MSLYKAEMGISNKKPTRSRDSDAAASVTRQQPKEVATKDSTKKIWKGSDIARLKPWEFEKVEAMQAVRSSKAAVPSEAGRANYSPTKYNHLLRQFYARRSGSKRSGTSKV